MDGKPRTQRRPVLNTLKKFLAKHGLPEIRFHDLRHTCATLLLSKNVNPKIVSEMLGHGDGQLERNYRAPGNARKPPAWLVGLFEGIGLLVLFALIMVGAANISLVLATFLFLAISGLIVAIAVVYLTKWMKRPRANPWPVTFLMT
jgi:hypothetical protein